MSNTTYPTPPQNIDRLWSTAMDREMERSQSSPRSEPRAEYDGDESDGVQRVAVPLNDGLDEWLGPQMVRIADYYRTK